MEKLSSTLLILVLSILLISCNDTEKQTKLLSFDFKQKYKEKDFVIQDYADVDYLQLEKSSENPFHGQIQYFGPKYIIGYSYQTGNIHVYNRNGKIKTIFNQQGKGPEEYGKRISINFNELTDEILVHNYGGKTLYVFDTNGIFKHLVELDSKKGCCQMLFYKDDCFVCDNTTNNDTNSFYLVSPTTGKFVQDINIDFDKRVTSMVKKVTPNSQMIMYMGFARFVNSQQGLILNEISADTIYNYNNGELIPILAKMPKYSQTKPKEFSYITLESKDYYLFKTVKKDLVDNPNAKSDFKFSVSQNLFQISKNGGESYKIKVKNKDFDYKPFWVGEQYNSEEYICPIEAVQVLEMYEDEKLSGKILEIAKNIKEDDAPVLMISRFN
jgi:hypothetical protein